MRFQKWFHPIMQGNKENTHVTSNWLWPHCAGGVRAYAYQEVYQPHGRESFKQLVGDVKFRHSDPKPIIPIEKSAPMFLRHFSIINFNRKKRGFSDLKALMDYFAHHFWKWHAAPPVSKLSTKYRKGLLKWLLIDKIIHPHKIWGNSDILEFVIGT